MRQIFKRTIVGWIAAAVLVASNAAVGEPVRKIKSQVQPEVPEMARRMHLKGTVRLEVEVAADGKVTSTKALGGHPLLIESAEQAVRKWRYEPGPAAKFVVEFDFHQEK